MFQSNPNYGYKLNQDRTKRMECPDEQAVIALARELRANNLSYAKIVKRLTANGMKSRTGKPFLVPAVVKMAPFDISKEETI